jgi:hypothetical protein
MLAIVLMPFGFLAHKVLNKKSLKIPKGQSESVCRRRTDNTLAKRKSNLAFQYLDLERT